MQTKAAATSPDSPGVIDEFWQLQKKMVPGSVHYNAYHMQGVKYLLNE